MRKYRKAKNLKNPWDTGPFKAVNSATFTAIDFKATVLSASGVLFFSSPNHSLLSLML